MFATTPAEKWLRGPVGFAVISIMHVFVISLIATALNQAGKSEIPPPAIKVISEIAEPIEHRPPPIGPKPDGPMVIKPELPPVLPNEPDENPVATDPSTDSFLGVTATGGGIVDPPVFGPRIDPRSPLAQPDYPSSEIRKGNEGRVLIRLRIGRTGQVLAAEVVRSSGFPQLDRAALRTALREWRFLPARQGEAAIEGEFQTWVRFSLSDR
jgi:protein TonB